MSIQRLSDRGGKYLVRWREGGRQRSQLFDRKGDAEVFELEIKRRKQLGTLAASVMLSRTTLSELCRTSGGRAMRSRT